MSKIPRNLREQLSRHNVIPFVGAGVSCAILDSKKKTPLFPDWKSLLENIYDELIEEKKKPAAERLKKLLEKNPPDYLGAAEVGWNHLHGPSVLTKNFDVLSEDAQRESLRLARSIWNLGSRVIFTTNFDPVMEWVCPKPSDHRVVCHQPNALTQMSRNDLPDRYYTWHLHGSVLHDVENVIFTRTQYDNFYGKSECTRNTLRTFLSTKTFLFIGFSLNDDYFCQNLRDIDKIFHGAANSYYVLVKRGTRINPLLKNIVIPIEFDEYEVDLPKLIDEMGEIANAKKRWFRDARVFLEYFRYLILSPVAKMALVYVLTAQVIFSPNNSAPEPVNFETRTEAPPVDNSGGSVTSPVKTSLGKETVKQKQSPPKAKQQGQKNVAASKITEQDRIGEIINKSGATIKPEQLRESW